MVEPIDPIHCILSGSDLKKNSLIKNNPVKTQNFTINLQSDTIDSIKHKI